MSQPNESNADPEAELHALDAALERVRRRLYAVENGLVEVPDPGGEADLLRAELASLGERFRAAYQRWQASERVEAESH